MATGIIRQSKDSASILLIPSGIELHPDFPDATARLAAWYMMRTCTSKERMLGNHWINVSWDTAHRKWKHYDQIRNHALESGWLECNHKYCTGLEAKKRGIQPYTKSYRIAEQYRTGRFVQYHLSKQQNKPTWSTDHNTKAGNLLAEKLPMVWLPEDLEPGTYWDAYTFAAIRMGHFYSSRCRYGRFFSPYTSLRSRYRARLQAREDLSRLDIKSSQPLFLAAVAVDLWGRVEPDIAHWIEICQDGDLYQEFVDCLHGVYTREECKELFMKVMFAKVPQMAENPLFPMITERFPTLRHVLFQLKTFDHKEVAYKLQRLESGVMIDTVALEYCKAHKVTPLVTVHDEMILPSRHVGWVSKRITKACKPYGISPKLRVTENE